MADLVRRAQRLNRLHTRKAYLESTLPRESLTLPLERVRQLKREYARVVSQIARLEARSS